MHVKCSISNNFLFIKTQNHIKLLITISKGQIPMLNLCLNCSIKKVKVYRTLEARGSVRLVKQPLPHPCDQCCKMYSFSLLIYCIIDNRGELNGRTLRGICPAILTRLSVGGRRLHHHDEAARRCYMQDKIKRILPAPVVINYRI